MVQSKESVEVGNFLQQIGLHVPNQTESKIGRALVWFGQFDTVNRRIYYVKTPKHWWCRWMKESKWRFKQRNDHCCRENSSMRGFVLFFFSFCCCRKCVNGDRNNGNYIYSKGTFNGEEGQGSSVRLQGSLCLHHLLKSFENASSSLHLTATVTIYRMC